MNYVRHFDRLSASLVDSAALASPRTLTEKQATLLASRRERLNNRVQYPTLSIIWCKTINVEFKTLTHLF